MSIDQTGAYMGVINGLTPYGDMWGGGPEADFDTPPKVIADANRHSLATTESTTVNWMTEFFNTTTKPVGHGFSQDNLKSGMACYSFVPKSDIPIKFIVLDDTVKGPGQADYAAGALDDARYQWLVDELNAGQTANQLMIIAAHVPILPQNSLTDTTPFPMWPGPEYTEDYVLNTLHQYPNLILWMAGHRHVNVVTPQPDPHGDPTLAFWEVETCSLRDHPQQFRTFDIRRNSDNTVSIIITNVDPAVRARVAGLQLAWLRAGRVPDFRRHSSHHRRHHVAFVQRGAGSAVDACHAIGHLAGGGKDSAIFLGVILSGVRSPCDRTQSKDRYSRCQCGPVCFSDGSVGVRRWKNAVATGVLRLRRAKAARLRSG